MSDEPHPSGDDRYAVYAVTGRTRHRLAETSREGVGLTIETLRADGDLTASSRVGVLDRETRDWLINPWA